MSKNPNKSSRLSNSESDLTVRVNSGGKSKTNSTTRPSTEILSKSDRWVNIIFTPTTTTTTESTTTTNGSYYTLINKYFFSDVMNELVVVEHDFSSKIGGEWRYSDSDIRCIVSTNVNGYDKSLSQRNYSVSDDSEGSISVGDSSIMSGITTQLSTHTPFNGDIRGVFYDYHNLLGTTQDSFIITIENGVVISIVSFSVIILCDANDDATITLITTPSSEDSDS